MSSFALKQLIHVSKDHPSHGYKASLMIKLISCIVMYIGIVFDMFFVIFISIAMHFDPCNFLHYFELSWIEFIGAGLVDIRFDEFIMIDY